MLNPIVEVEICLGSSCFIRGNSQTLKNIETFIEDKGLEERCLLKGQLCLNECSKGPVMKINGVTYQGVHPECAVDILKQHLGKED